jgi:hypothetical protein
MAAVMPILVQLTGQLKISLVHESCWCQGVSGALPGEMAGRDPAEFRINDVE